MNQRRLGWEVLLVLGVSLGQSAVYAVVRLADMLSRGPLSEAQARMNTSQSERPWFDLTYQLLGIGFALVPVLLALYLLGREGNPFHRMGFDFRRPRRDAFHGVLLLLAIGIPTLGVYAAGRALGLTAEIHPANLGAHWWTVPVLLLAAAKNGVLEEVLVVGYLSERLREMRWGWPMIIGVSALLRGSYHLYQGIGPFLGNVAMGVLFGLYYMRTGRVMPLVAAHTAIDVIGFTAPGVLAAVDPTSS